METCSSNFFDLSLNRSNWGVGLGVLVTTTSHARNGGSIIKPCLCILVNVEEGLLLV
jgi:hypothetical protein